MAGTAPEPHVEVRPMVATDIDDAASVFIRAISAVSVAHDRGAPEHDAVLGLHRPTPGRFQSVTVLLEQRCPEVQRQLDGNAQTPGDAAFFVPRHQRLAIDVRARHVRVVPLRQREPARHQARAAHARDAASFRGARRAFRLPSVGVGRSHAVAIDHRLRLPAASARGGRSCTTVG